MSKTRYPGRRFWTGTRPVLYLSKTDQVQYSPVLPATLEHAHAAASGKLIRIALLKCTKQLNDGFILRIGG